jgi:4-amino-4-deoxy-L-arabinose transferase-like glycosyltransferase
MIGVPSALNLLVYENHPHIEDEVAYVQHARMLAAGVLHVPAPPVPAAFEMYLIDTVGGRSFVVTPPGWPAVLSLGMNAGVPWLVNPLLSGISVLLLYRLAGEIYGRQAAQLAVALFCLSPWQIFLAMSFMNHVLVLACALAAAYLAFRARHSLRAWPALASALAAGCAWMARPLDGMVLAALLALWLLTSLRRRRVLVAAFATGFAAIAALGAAYNYSLTGHPFEMPLRAYNDKIFGPGAGDLGFGPNRGFGWALDPFPGHSLRDAAINANLNLTAINVELFGWGAGSLLLVIVVLISLRLDRRHLPFLTLLAAVPAAYCFYYFSGGPDFGARYWHLVLVPLVLLTVSGLQFLQERLGSEGWRALIFVAALSVSTVLTFLPWRAADKYYRYLQMTPELHELARVNGFGGSLVLVRGNMFPDYSSSIVYNPIDLRADSPVYVWDRSDEVRNQILKSFPDRPVWVVEGPSRTGGDFRVVAGPIPPGRLDLAPHL